MWMPAILLTNIPVHANMVEVEIPLVCGEGNCRKKVGPTDFEDHYEMWDEKIKKSITKLFDVEQPLMPLIDPETRLQLDGLFHDPTTYRSVYALRYNKEEKAFSPISENGQNHH